MKYHQIDRNLFIKNRAKFTTQMKPNSVAVFNSNDIYPVSADSSLPFEQHRDIFYDQKLYRSGSCWSLRKAQNIVKPEDYIHPQDSTFIPYNAAGDLIGLSDLFNSKDTFYCYDNYTYISIQSLMCNTDTVIIPSKKTKQEFQNGYELNKYLAYGIDDLPRAKSIRNEFFDHLNRIEENTEKQLDKFIEICYDYFK